MENRLFLVLFYWYMQPTMKRSGVDVRSSCSHFPATGFSTTDLAQYTCSFQHKRSLSLSFLALLSSSLSLSLSLYLTLSPLPLFLYLNSLLGGVKFTKLVV